MPDYMVGYTHGGKTVRVLSLRKNMTPETKRQLTEKKGFRKITAKSRAEAAAKFAGTGKKSIAFRRYVR